MTLSTIPYEDFGGNGPLMHFAHANGYPPGAYKPLLTNLSKGFCVMAMRMRPLWDDADPDLIHDWRPLANDLEHFFIQQGAHNLIGVGHSFGATITLHLALRKPDLFKILVLIDPVLFPPWMVCIWQFFSKWGIQHFHPLVRTSLRRRSVFQSKSAMFTNYRQKHVFKRIDNDGLRAYVEAIAQPMADGNTTLSYTPRWEAHIYATSILADNDIWRCLNCLKPRILVIRGIETDTFWPTTARLFQRRLPKAIINTIPDAGHLVALERPSVVAHAIRKFTAASDRQHER